MKYSQWIGVIAALLLIGACFMPWAYFPDLDKEFTGFFSQGNIYGKPGKVIIFFLRYRDHPFSYPEDLGQTCQYPGSSDGDRLLCQSLPFIFGLLPRHLS